MSTTTTIDGGTVTAVPAQPTTQQAQATPPYRPRWVHMRIPPMHGTALVRYDEEMRIYGFAGMAVHFPREGEWHMLHTDPREFGQAMMEKRKPRLLLTRQPRAAGRLFEIDLHGHPWDVVLENMTPGGHWGVISMFKEGLKGRPHITEERIRSTEWAFPRKRAMITRPDSYDVYSDGFVMHPDAHGLALYSDTPWSLVRNMALNLGIVNRNKAKCPFADDGRNLEGGGAIEGNRVFPQHRRDGFGLPDSEQDKLGTAKRRPRSEIGDGDFSPELINRLAAALAAQKPSA